MTKKGFPGDENRASLSLWYTGQYRITADEGDHSQYENPGPYVVMGKFPTPRVAITNSIPDHSIFTNSKAHDIVVGQL